MKVEFDTADWVMLGLWIVAILGLGAMILQAWI